MKTVYQTAVQKYEEYGQFLNPEDLLKWTIEHFGVDKIVMGTAVVENIGLLKNACKKFKNRIAISLDTRDGFIALSGWTKQTNISALDFIREIENFGVSRIIYTDINRDGKIDFFILDMLSRQHDKRMTQILHTPPISRPIGLIDNRPQNSQNALFLNRGDNTYSEIAQFSGIQASDWSWSNLFVDIDLDGYEDVIISTGHYYDALDGDALNQQSNRNFYDLENWQNSLFDYPSLELPNVAFRNLGNLRFEDKSSEWGFTSVDISHGMALGDLDNDGDLDVVMNRLNDPAAIYRNDSNAPRIAVRLRGDSPNTQGIGSKVKLLGGPVDQMKEVISGGSYLSGSDPLVSFAAWDEKREFTLEVTWRSGEVSRIEGVKGNRLYEVYESSLDPNHDLEDRPINKKIKKLASTIHVQ